MKDIALFEVSRSEFEALTTCCAHDPGVPKTWDAWQSLMAQARKEAEEASMQFPSMLFHTEAFTRWCEVVGIVPGLDALRAYAIVKRAPKAIARGLHTRSPGRRSV